MANTYTQIYIHIIFAVQNRQNLIRDEFSDQLQKYMTGIITDKKSKLISINNMPDHLHMLVGLRPDTALSNLVADVKSASSRLINDRRWCIGRFHWQEGFGAFSYSHSQLSDVIGYLEHQREHHKSRSFMEEYLELLKKFDVAYDERYIFKPVE